MAWVISTQILLKLIGLILGPLILLNLGDYEFGQYERFITVSSVISPFIFLGIDAAYTFYIYKEKNVKNIEGIIYSLILCVIMMPVLYVTGIILDVHPFTLICFSYSQAIFLLLIKYYRVNRLLKKYFFIGLSFFLLNLGLFQAEFLKNSNNVINIRSYIYMVIIVIMFTYILSRTHNISINKGNLKKYFKYGIPLLPYGFLYNYMIGVDKLHIASESELIMAAFYNKIGILILTFAVILKPWINPKLSECFFEEKNYNNVNKQIDGIKNILLIVMYILSIIFYFNKENVSTYFNLNDINFNILYFYLVSFYFFSIYSIEILYFNLVEKNILLTFLIITSTIIFTLVNNITDLRYYEYMIIFSVTNYTVMKISILYHLYFKSSHNKNLTTEDSKFNFFNVFKDFSLLLTLVEIDFFILIILLIIILNIWSNRFTYKSWLKYESL